MIALSTKQVWTEVQCLSASGCMAVFFEAASSSRMLIRGMREVRVGWGMLRHASFRRMLLEPPYRARGLATHLSEVSETSDR